MLGTVGVALKRQERLTSLLHVVIPTPASSRIGASPFRRLVGLTITTAKLFLVVEDGPHYCEWIWTQRDSQAVCPTTFSSYL